MKKNAHSQSYFEKDQFDEYDHIKLQSHQRVEKLIKDHESFSVTDYEDLGFLISEDYLWPQLNKLGTTAKCNYVADV